jgi:DMSO reductase anchor subunit
LLQAIALGLVLLVAGLASSFLHLGHKMRAWRAVLMWRTSWMSREVIVLPADIALATLWWLSLYTGAAGALAHALPWLVVLGALLLWYCTAMIYACLRFIQEWAHWSTVANFIFIGLASGTVLTCALAASSGQAALLDALAPWATLATLLASIVRWFSLRRNKDLRPASTLQSATGIQGKRLVQKSMGMSAGAFNTREFFHGASQLALRNVRWAFVLGLFVLPLVLELFALRGGTAWPWAWAALLQAPALIAERWVFFAQAKHPQNLYYQVVG